MLVFKLFMITIPEDLDRSSNKVIPQVNLDTRVHVEPKLIAKSWILSSNAVRLTFPLITCQSELKLQHSWFENTAWACVQSWNELMALKTSSLSLLNLNPDRLTKFMSLNLTWWSEIDMITTWRNLCPCDLFDKFTLTLPCKSHMSEYIHLIV